MVILAKRAIKEFVEKNPKAEEPLFRWYFMVSDADWSNFSDLKKDFGSTDSVGNDLYVFNIGGNKYRLIARIIFKARTLFIRFIGTHKEYDRINQNDL